MKKIIICAVILATAFVTKSAYAQVRVNLNVNIASQPLWGPTGYDHVDYYYLPDIECYYYVPNRQFVYLSGKRWIFSASLPSRYRNYDLNTGYKVVVNEPKPYLHFKQHRDRYSNFRNNHSQTIIRNSNEPKYYVVKGHPKYKAPYHKHGRH